MQVDGAVLELQVTPEAIRTLAALPDAVRDAALGALSRTIRRDPVGAGTALVGEMEGLWVADRGDHRIVYQIVEKDDAVLLHGVHHRWPHR